MARALPHTDCEVDALVQRLINEDKGRQDVLLNLDFQFEDSCADRRLHLSMYGKASQLEKQMDAKLAWFQEKYFGRTHRALKEMLEEEAMNKKAQGEKIRQEQAENDAFFLEFRVVRAYRATHHCGDRRGSSLEEVASVGRSSSLAVTSSGLSSDVSDVGLPSEKVMASGKNGDDGDLLLFRDGPGACDISAGTLSLLGYGTVPLARLPEHSGSSSWYGLESEETFREYTLHTIKIGDYFLLIFHIWEKLTL
ncbi:hypothetical protein Tco_1157045 [Tanacetum coccineum]